MANSKNLGEFEILVLAALIRLDDQAYGLSILREIEAKTQRSVTIGALYSTLSRLAEKKYVETRMGEATAERGGRAKRYYELTAIGREKFEQSIFNLNNMLEGLHPWKGKPAQ